MSTIIATSAPDQTCLTIQIRGHFDAGDRTAFEGAYSTALPGTHFVVDLSEAEDMTADSLHVLLGLRHHAGAGDSQVDIINTSNKVRTILELMNFEQLFDID